MKKYLEIKTAAYFILIPLACLFLSSGTSLSLAEEDVDIKSIIDSVDRLYRSDFSRGEMEMRVVSEHWERTLSMNMWTEGMEKTFIYITSPKKDAGMATLRVGTEMWNYFPKINKVMKVPPSMMMGSWMGSDFTNDDLVKESSMLEDYTHRLIHPENEEVDKYYIELIPRIETPTVWGKIEITIRKEDYIPLTQVYYDEKGKKMRVMTFSDVRHFGSRKIPAEMEMIPLHKKGQKTVVRYKDILFDEKIDKSVFTLRNLQKRR
jgi:outer membrane lipoprotein-sorting protein